MHFAVYKLQPLTPLHLGAYRTGMVARTHRFVPAHLLTYALVAVVARARRIRDDGGYRGILQEIQETLLFGPAFVMEGGRRLSFAEIERRFVKSRHHVTLEPESRSALTGALFEFEVLEFPRSGSVCLGGGFWSKTRELDGKPLSDCLDQLQLGGEWKIGYGRVHCLELRWDVLEYPGVGRVEGDAVWIEEGGCLPGPALNGVEGVPWRPWIGRRYDPNLGYGRALSEAVLVRLNGTVSKAGRYRPCPSEPGLGCWQRIE